MRFRAKVKLQTHFPRSPMWLQSEMNMSYIYTNPRTLWFPYACGVIVFLSPLLLKYTKPVLCLASEAMFSLLCWFSFCRGLECVQCHRKCRQMCYWAGGYGKDGRKVSLCCRGRDIIHYDESWSYRRDVLKTLNHILTQRPPATLGNHYSAGKKKIVFPNMSHRLWRTPLIGCLNHCAADCSSHSQSCCNVYWV